MEEEEEVLWSEEAIKYVWDGGVPLHIHLHPSEVASLPPPPPTFVLGPRIGYLPLLIPLLKPHFHAALPPGADTVWFDYNGLPLKWYIPIGVLFDLLCAEPERPWNLTVHFRGYPSDLLIPCGDEDSVKWSFINTLKEAAYITNGNCKNIMNMSQADQLELWQSVVKGNIESYLRVTSKLKLGPLGKDCLLKRSFISQPRTGQTEAINASSHTGRIPVRLYVRYISEGVDLNDASPLDNWDSITYVNRPIEIKKEGSYLTLQTAMESLLPDIFNSESSLQESSCTQEELVEADSISAAPEAKEEKEGEPVTGHQEGCIQTWKSRVKLIRIQGIEPGLAAPFAWIVNNLANPDYFLHICVFVTSDDSSK